MSDLDSYYKVLGLEPGASLEEVNQAYRDLVFVWHPDRLPKDNPRLQEIAHQKIKELNQARDRLRSDRANQQSPTAGRNSSGKNSTGNPTGKSSSGKNSTGKNAGSEPSSRQSRPESRYEPRTAPPRYHTYQPPPRHYSYYQSPSSNSGNAARGHTNSKSSTGAPTGASPNISNGGSKQQDGHQPPKPSPRPQHPDLSGTNLSGADLREKDLSGRNLSQANLSNANLSDAFLHRINFSGADLSGANLFRANLLEANLSNANLQGANLIGADLSGADLRGANLKGARIGVSDRLMVKLTGARLTGMTMPDGSIHT